MTSDKYDFSQDPIHRHSRPRDVAVTVPGQPYRVQLAAHVDPALRPAEMLARGFDRVIPTSQNIKVGPKGDCPAVIVGQGYRSLVLPAFLYQREDIQCTQCVKSGWPCLSWNGSMQYQEDTGTEELRLSACYYCVPDPRRPPCSIAGRVCPSSAATESVTGRAGLDAPASPSASSALDSPPPSASTAAFSSTTSASLSTTSTGAQIVRTTEDELWQLHLEDLQTEDGERRSLWPRFRPLVEKGKQTPLRPPYESDGNFRVKHPSRIDYQNRNAELQKSISAQEATIAQQENTVAQRQRMIDEMREQMTTSGWNHQARIRTFTEERDELEAKIGELESKVEALESKNRVLEGETVSNKREIADLKSVVQDRDLALARLEETHETERSQLTALRQCLQQSGIMPQSSSVGGTSTAPVGGQLIPAKRPRRDVESPQPTSSGSNELPKGFFQLVLQRTPAPNLSSHLGSTAAAIPSAGRPPLRQVDETSASARSGCPAGPLTEARARSVLEKSGYLVTRHEEGGRVGFKLKGNRGQWNGKAFEKLGWRFGSFTPAWTKYRFLTYTGRCRTCVSEGRPCIRAAGQPNAGCLTCGGGPCEG